MEQKENVKKRFRLFDLSRKSIVFLVGMLLVLGIMYITLPFELTVAGAIVVGVVIAYESARALIFWIGSLIVSIIRRVFKGLRRAAYVAKMPDDEFEACFSGKQEGGEPPSDNTKESESDGNNDQAQPDGSTETPAQPTRASRLPEHAQIHPLTPVQAAAKAMDWWTYVGLDGLDGKERLSMLIERLREEIPDEKSYNLVDYGKELCLPDNFAVLQALAELLSNRGYEANAEEDTMSLFVMEAVGTEEKGADTDIKDSTNDGEQSAQEDTPSSEDESAQAKENGVLQLLVVQPGQQPKMLEIPHTDDELEKLIGSPFVISHPFDDSVVLVHRSSFDVAAASLNRCVDLATGGQLIITGVFLIAGWNKDTFVSLPEEMLAKYTDVFLKTPLFIKNQDQSYSIYQ